MGLLSAGFTEYSVTLYRDGMAGFQVCIFCKSMCPISWIDVLGFPGTGEGEKIRRDKTIRGDVRWDYGK